MKLHRSSISITVKTAILIVVIFCFGLIGLLWNKELQQMDSDKEATISRAVQRNSNLALALENYTIRTIENADMALQLVRWEYEKNKTFSGYHDLFKGLSFDRSLLNAIGIVDVGGKIISSSYAYHSDTILNFADREYFTYHLNHSEDILYISKPTLSKSIGKTVITFSRRLNNKEGNFEGVVVLRILPSTFTSFYEGAVINPHDIVSLIAPDGITYARQTGPVSGYGEDISKSPLFNHLAQKPAGFYFAKDAIQGIPTYFSYRKLKQYPIIATVGTSENDVLEFYRQRERREIINSSIVSCLIVLFSSLVCIGILYRRRNLRALKVNEEKYRLIFENSRDAIILYGTDGEILALNPSAYHVFKIAPHEKDPLNFAELTLQENTSAGAIENTSPPMELNGEHKFYCRDGSWFYGEVASSSYHNAKNNEVIVAVIRDTTERKKLEENLSIEKKTRQQMITKQVIQAQEREREAIGRELHDNVGQILSTVKLYLDIVTKNTDAGKQLLPKSVELLIGSIQEIRNLSHELSAPTLGTKSLVDSINDLLQNVNSSASLHVQFSHDEDADKIEMEQKLAIYRVVQEQLNNILKHAQATSAHISLEQTTGQIKLTIKDNGKGFDPHVNRSGIGLNNIEARAKAFSGYINIITAPEKGCTLEVYFPIVK
ncbi:MAG: PAS domain S-box protein [Ginsengibacter sp.]